MTIDRKKVVALKSIRISRPMADFILKAFVLCDRIADSSGSAGQRDLFGAGLNRLLASTPFPIKRTFWVYIEISDEKATGDIQLSVMRA
jgi:hypothetical protein